MITEMRIQNLRSIKDSGIIKMKPLMILLGANSSGKSTFLRSFPLFTQSVDKKLTGPIAWFDNAYVDFGDYKTAINKYSSFEDGITFSYKYINPLLFPRIVGRTDSVSFEDISKGNVSFTLKNDNKGTYISNFIIENEHVKYGFTIKERNDEVAITVNDCIPNISNKFKFNFNTDSAILPYLVPVKITDEVCSFSEVVSNKLVAYLKKYCNKKLQNEQRLYEIISYFKLGKTSFLNFLKRSSIKSLANAVKNWRVTNSEFNELYNLYLLLKANYIIGLINLEIASFYHRCDYIAPMRAEAGRYYRMQGLQVQSVDPTGHNLIEFLASLKFKQKNNYDDFLKDLLGITVYVSSESGMKSLMIKSDNGDFNIADVGYGYSQVLPIITKLWHSSYLINDKTQSERYYYMYEYKNVILMEQPELHLHPSMQAKVADVVLKVLQETSKDGDSDLKSFYQIVETHSQTLINRIGRRIREGAINKDDVNVIMFEKDSEQKNTLIKQISFNDKGQLENWPHGFFDPND